MRSKRALHTDRPNDRQTDAGCRMCVRPALRCALTCSTRDCSFGDTFQLFLGSERQLFTRSLDGAKHVFSRRTLFEQVRLCMSECFGRCASCLRCARVCVSMRTCLCPRCIQCDLTLRMFRVVAPHGILAIRGEEWARHSRVIGPMLKLHRAAGASRCTHGHSSLRSV